MSPDSRRPPPGGKKKIDELWGKKNRVIVALVAGLVGASGWSFWLVFAYVVLANFFFQVRLASRLGVTPKNTQLEGSTDEPVSFVGCTPHCVVYRTAPLFATSRPPRPFPLPTRSRRRPFRLLLLGHGHGPFVTDVARSEGEADPVPVCDRGRAGTQYGHLGQGVKKKKKKRSSLSELRARGFAASCESRVFLVLLFLSSPLFLSLSVRIPLPVQVYERSLSGVVKGRLPRPPRR